MIEVNKKYTTRDGKEVRIYATDGLGAYPVHGAILEYGIWGINSWTEYGEQEGRHKSEKDLVGVWAPQDKEPIWCWNAGDISKRTLRFWDAKGSATFSFRGERGGLSEYKNYEKVQHVEQWMLDAQAKLEN